MSDWIGLGVFVLVIVVALVAASRLGKPRREISVEEFEERARSGGGAAAAMFGLQKLMNPPAAKSVEVLQDLKGGYYNKKRLPGEGDDEEGMRAGEPGEAEEIETNRGQGLSDEGSVERDA